METSSPKEQEMIGRLLRMMELKIWRDQYIYLSIFDQYSIQLKNIVKNGHRMKIQTLLLVGDRFVHRLFQQDHEASAKNLSIQLAQSSNRMELQIFVIPKNL